MRTNSVNYLPIVVVMACLALGIFSCMTAKKKAAMSENKPLTETYWILTHVKGENVPKCIITPFIVFDNDGSYSGNLSCNSYFGKYSSHKGKIKMEYEGATKKLCQNMKVEKMFMQQLHADFKRYEIRKDTLYLMDAQGEVLRFKAGVKPD